MKQAIEDENKNRKDRFDKELQKAYDELKDSIHAGIMDDDRMHDDDLASSFFPSGTTFTLPRPLASAQACFLTPACVLAADEFEDALLEDAPGMLLGSGSTFPDPLDDVKKRRKFGTDQPETWDAMPPGADHAEVLLFTARRA